MNEAELHLINSLERLDASYSEGLEKLHDALLALEKRIRVLEAHYPEFAKLCNELEQLLLHSNS